MRDELLRLALLSFPRSRRARDGQVMLDCAREMIDAGASPGAEAAGLLAAGLRSRVEHLAGPATRAPWGAALDRLALPLACFVLVLFGTGAASSVWGQLGLWWATAVVAAAAALAGAALRLRPVAVAGWSTLLAVDAYAVLDSHFLDSPTRFSATLASGGVDVQAAVLPVLLLGLASAWSLRPDGRRGVPVALGAVAAAVVLGDRVRSGGLLPWDSPETRLMLFVAVLAAPLLLAAWAAGRREPRTLACAALVLAAAAPTLAWWGTGFTYAFGYLPYALGMAILVSLGLAATAAVVALARASGRRSAPG